ncbi:MAG: membrane dipeptidase [Porphyromonadaceae bacterium]|nr:membrane dipeptidase [Porphyromonadaceae bacterium]
MKYRDLSPELCQLNEEIDRYLGRGQSVSPSYLGTPRIGITVHCTDSGSSLALAYSDAVIRAGGVPLMLPLSDDTSYLLSALQTVDALLLTGGNDIHPRYIGEEPLRGLGKVLPLRDRYELKLIRLARMLALPILGICRGHQVLGVAYGSLLYQDLASQHRAERPLDHSPNMPRGEEMHRVEVSYGCRLRDILGLEEDTLWVNSLHHQAIREVCLPFYGTAVASDEINEAMDAYPELDILAIQWHPEQMIVQGDERQLRLLAHLVARASLYRRARAFHTQNIVLDSHTDTPMCFEEGFDIARLGKSLVDIPKLELGQVSAAVMVGYLPQGELTEEAYAAAFRYIDDKLSELRYQVESSSGRAVLASDVVSIVEAKQRGQVAIIPAVENGYAIGQSLSALRELRERHGIVYMTLCHNGDNAICDSGSKTQHTHGGLSLFGREVVREMNDLGIVIDVSHAGEDTVRDVLEISRLPIVASHSSAHALCAHPRNLTDEQIRAIAECGGVIQVCLYAWFINEEGDRASYLDAVDHIEHIIRLVGIEHVGIGSDFDGDGQLVGCRGSHDLIRITMELLDRGYTERDLALIWGGNFLRVLQANEEGKL